MVVGDSGCEMAEMVSVATSKTLSANSASLFKSVVASVEARTIQTLPGSLWRNNSRCLQNPVCRPEVAAYVSAVA